MSTPVIQIVGYKNAGKTTLLEQLIRNLSEAGYKVGTVKHDAHQFEVDHEGTDTWRHRRAGAAITAIASATRTAIMAETGSSLDEILQHMQGVDIVLVEGFKQERYPKIVMVRAEEDAELVRLLEHVAAVVSWNPEFTCDAAVFPICDTQRLFEWMLREFL